MLDLYEQWMMAGAPDQIDPSDRVSSVGRSPSIPTGTEVPFRPWLVEDELLASAESSRDPGVRIIPDRTGRNGETTEFGGLETRTGTLDEFDDVPDFTGESRMRRADASGRWAWKRIPGIEEIEGRDVLRTPRVGRVRVVFHNGEVFEGRLFAVGGGNVTVDTNLGRVAFDTFDVSEIRPALGAGVGQINGRPSIAGLPKVRVQVAGGWIEGHELSRKNGQVLLVDERGYRIALESDDVSDARGRSP